MSIYTKREFWTSAAERAVKTFAQALAAVGLAGATGLLGVDWPGALSAAGLAALLSVLTSVGSAPVGEPGPSLGGELVHVPRHAPPSVDPEPEPDLDPIVTSSGPEWPEGDR